MSVPPDKIDQPGVSVVIPAYNYERFLPKAIDSALAQTYPNIEVVVVDDGSTDNTRQVVAGYENRVRYIYQPNAGLPAARNTGIQSASYPFVAFLDADDVLEPGCVASAMANFARLGGEFGLVACSASAIDVNGDPLTFKNTEGRLTGEITTADLILMTRFSPSGVVAKKMALEEAGYFDTTLRSSEDRDMWIRVSFKKRIFLQPEALVRIRRHGNNMSGNADRMKSNMRKVLRKGYDSGKISRFNLSFWLQVMGVYYYQTALLYNGNRRRWQAFADTTKSLLAWPLPFHPSRLGTTITLIRLRLLCRILLDRK